MVGVLRAAGRDDEQFAFGLEGAEGWMHVPCGRCFRGATYVPGKGLLVLHLSVDDPETPAAVVLDVDVRRSAHRETTAGATR